MGRRKAKPWAKLDFDFFEDEALLQLEKRSSRDAYAWVKLVAMWADYDDARIDMKDEGVRLKMRMKLGLGDRALENLFDRLADLGLIHADLWRELRVVTNERAATDAATRQRQRDGGGSKKDASEGASSGTASGT